MKNTVQIIILSIVFFITGFTKSGKLLAHVDKMLFLQGKIGEKTIVVKIKCYDESPVRYLNYFFEDEKMDQYMEGNLIGNAWQFITVNNSKKEINLVIREEKNGNWKGFWREGANKKTDLILKPLEINPDLKYYYYSQQKELDPYDTHKIASILLNKTDTEKISKDFSLDWYLEKESGIHFFRLHSETQKTNLDSINKVLEMLQLSFIQNYFHFNPNIENSGIEPKILYLNEKLISFKILSNLTFTTQQKITTQQLLTLNIQNGQQIDLESLLWFDDKNQKPDINDVAQTYEYRKKIFAPKVFAILNELYPEKMQSGDCDLNKVSTWAIPNFALTKKGILFCFSHTPNCSLMDWAIIPYDKLIPYLEKKYKLN